MGASGPFQDKPSLRVEGISLARGGRVLFEDMSFAAAPGAYIELRGANGSGKTSLLRALAGYLKARTGRITFDIPEPALALHFVGHTNGLKREASVREHLRYWSGLFGVEIELETERLAGFGLADQIDLPGRALSQGQARRLALMRLSIAPRPIWLLDEPAAALDAQGGALLIDLLQLHRMRGGFAIAAVHEPLGPTPTQTISVGA